MAAAGVPTARAYVCTTPAEIDEALDAFGAPYVVKDDGLAAGKGVVVTDDRRGRPRARAGLRPASSSRSSSTARRSRSSRSPTATTVVPLQPAQDFKRALRRRRGPEHRRHGRVLAAALGRPRSWSTRSWRRVVQPTVDELRRRGTPFSGLLYAGLAITSRGHAGHRVQRALRRPGDPGRAGPADDPAGRGAARRRQRHARPRCRRCAGATARRSPSSSPRTTTRTPRAPATRSTAWTRWPSEDGARRTSCTPGTARTTAARWSARAAGCCPSPRPAPTWPRPASGLPRGGPDRARRLPPPYGHRRRRRRRGGRRPSGRPRARTPRGRRKGLRVSNGSQRPGRRWACTGPASPVVKHRFSPRPFHRVSASASC